MSLIESIKQKLKDISNWFGEQFTEALPDDDFYEIEPDGYQTNSEKINDDIC